MAKLVSGTRIYGTGTIDTQLLINGNINASSTITGALIVNGGIGIGGNLHVGGTINGSINGSSSQLQTISQSDNGSYYPLFVNNNNSVVTSESVYTTSSFTINPSTGNVGIGTSSPSVRLEVVGSQANWRRINNGNAPFYFPIIKSRGIDSAPTTVILGDAIGSFQFYGYNGTTEQLAAAITGKLDTTGTVSATSMPGAIDFSTTADGSNIAQTRMTLNSFGNLGIGTTSPAEKLTVGTSTDRAGLYNSGTTTQVRLGSPIAEAAMMVLQYDRTTGTYQFSEGLNGNTSSPDITVLSNGSVGIGTSLPVRPLDVVGTQTTDGSATTVIRIQSSTAYNASPASGILFSNVYSSGGLTAGMGAISVLKENGVDGDYAGAIAFYTRINGGEFIERVRITSNGGISVGSSGTTYGSAGQLLQSNGNASPSWISPSNLIVAQSTLTNTYIGYGSASNILTGSSYLTWDGSKLDVLGGSNNGYIRFANSLGTKLRFYDETNDKYGVEVQSSELRVYSGSAGDAAGGITFGKFDGTTFIESVRIRNDGNLSVNTISPNSVNGTNTARYLGIQGDGTVNSADGRIILSNPRVYGSIVANTTTAGRLYFQLLNASTGPTTDAAYIAALASGSGGTAGYGIDLAFYPKADNGSSSIAMRLDSAGNLNIANLTASKAVFTDASKNLTTTGTLEVAQGGTGQVSFANGEILVGNTSGNTLTKTTLTPGTGISITNGAGSITITNTNTASPTPDYVIQSYGII